ncbi:MAG: hypothetical protein KF910_05680 [Brevundimonas sp.]|uniref:hypothetical protein n=1 Tax=Brevundimonas sp. TaxID=1871086 RepID=UPI0025BC9635|nr:hypothetical protein [Brevundimonas sp.]MBX3477075.1 hypothetical protein [Brevundimonas sp.]
MGAEEALIDDDLYDEDLHGDYAQADIVEWYEARPVTVSTALATGSIITAFALGVLTAVGALALMGRLDD